jgi:hypothetical protein
MRKKLKFSGLAAVAFAVLFLGPAMGSSDALVRSSPVAFRGATRFHGATRFRPGFGHRAFFPHRAFFGARFAPGFARPFRLVPVWVVLPYPHWVYSRVYYGPPCYPY